MNLSNEYLDSVNKLLNKDKIELTLEQQKEIIRIYEQAFQNQVKKIKKCKNGTVAKKIAAVYSEQIYNELLDITEKYNEAMVDLYIDKTIEDLYSIQLESSKKEAFSTANDIEYKEFAKVVNKVSNITRQEIIEPLISGEIYKDNVGLSDRLWNIANSSGDRLSAAIQSCLAQGMGSVEMSKVLKEWAKEGHHTWNKAKIKEKLGEGYARAYGTQSLDYEALRLARTVINHQSQIASKMAHKINPYIGALKWRSSHTIGRTCQECIDRDGKIFTSDECPLDHPNGLCFLEPVYMINGREASLEEIADDLASWGRGEENSGTMNRIPKYKELHKSYFK